MKNINQLAHILNIFKSEKEEKGENQEMKEFKPFNVLENSTNTVRLCAKVEASYVNNKATTLYLCALDDHKNRPKVIFFNESRHTAAQFVEGDLVWIDGYIQSERLTAENKDKETNYIVGKTIEPLNDDMKNSPYLNLRANRLWLKGKVVDIRRKNKIVKMYVKTAVDNFFEFVPFDYYIQGTDYSKDVKIGDIIKVSGYVQTSDKLLEGKMVHFQNYTARYIEVLSDYKDVYVA